MPQWSWVKAHSAEALRWSEPTDAELVETLASGIGMAGPILLAAAMGHLSAGLAAAFGALAAGRVAAGSNFRAQARNLVAALAPAGLAAIAAVVAFGHGLLTDAIVLALACAAAAAGGYSRPLAAATTRFILILIITIAVIDGVSDRGGFLVLMAAGVAWTACLNVALGVVIRARRRVDSRAENAVQTQPTAAQKLTRWKKYMATLAGWQYAARLGSCLAVAAALRWLWPGHHMYWIALTVALLCQRRIEIVSVKTTQRALGTACGVVAAGILVASRPPAWGLVAIIGLLAVVRPFFRVRNYLIYSAVMTPLIILIMDAGRAPDGRVLVDRLGATIVGAALVIAANLIARQASPNTAP